jgi:ABC-type sugar transport system permease subunit
MKITLPGVKKGETLSGISFIAPFFILMAVFIVAVFVNAFMISLRDIRGMSFGGYNGFANYMDVFTHFDFFRAVLNSFIIACLCLVTQVPVSFLLANRLEAIPYKKLQGLLQASFFVPYLMMTVVIGLLYRMLFSGNPDFMNWLLSVFGLPHNFNWLHDRRNELFLILFASFWQNVGFQAAYFLSSLQSINPDLYESAMMDGASGAQIFFRIKLPLMRPAITFITVISAISSMMMFDLIFMIFPFGVRGIGVTILIYIFGRMFWDPFQRIGIACAASFIAFFIVLAVSLLQIRALGLGKAHDE